MDLAAKTKIGSSGSEDDNEKAKKKKNKQPQSLQGKSDGGSFKTGSTKTITRLTSSHMLSDVIQRNFNPTAIFESFERTGHRPILRHYHQMQNVFVLLALLSFCWKKIVIRLLG